MTPLVIAFTHAVQLATLAAEAAVAAGRISKVLQDRAAAGQEFTEADLADLLTDRATAQAMLIASIARRQVSGG
jgi:myo-inositol catabolism protein IolC